MTRQSGLALVLVLWVLSLLTIMAGSFALSMRRETAVTEGINTRAKAQAVAESGLAIAEMMLLNPDANKRWRTDGSIYEVASDTAKIRVRLFAEIGKIDINHANQTQLQTLIDAAPAPEEGTQKTNLVSAILDWRDEDEEVRIEGAEKPEYQAAGLGYSPRNKAFQSIDELQLVLGMNKDIFLWMQPLITVYSGQADVAVDTAAKEVLQLLPNIDTRLLDTYLAARLASAINNQPPPPLPSTSAEGGDVVLENTEDTAPDEPLAGMFTLVAESLLDDGSSAMLSVVIEPAEGEAIPFKVLKWQQITSADTSLFADEMSELLVKQYAQSEFDN